MSLVNRRRTSTLIQMPFPRNCSLVQIDWRRTFSAPSALPVTDTRKWITGVRGETALRFPANFRKGIGMQIRDIYFKRKQKSLQASGYKGFSQETRRADVEFNGSRGPAGVRRGAKIAAQAPGDDIRREAANFIALSDTIIKYDR